MRQTENLSVKGPQRAWKLWAYLYIWVQWHGSGYYSLFSVINGLHFILQGVCETYCVFHIEVAGFHLKGPGMFLAYLDVSA